MNVTRRLICIATLSGPPRVLGAVPPPPQDRGVHRAGVAVAGEDAGAADAGDVDKVATRDREEQRMESDPGGVLRPGIGSRPRMKWLSLGARQKCDIGC